MASLFSLRKYFFKRFESNCVINNGKNISTSCIIYINNKHFGHPASLQEKEKFYIENDNVPKNCHLIYKAPMESYIKWAMGFYTSTTAGICIASIYHFVNKHPIIEPIGTALTMQRDDIYYFAAGFLALSVALRLVVYMYPLRIYKNENTYIAAYHPQVPFTTSHHYFGKGQVKPVHYKFSPWNHVTYKLGTKPSLLLDDYFKTPSEFQQMQIKAK